MGQKLDWASEQETCKLLAGYGFAVTSHIFLLREFEGKLELSNFFSLYIRDWTLIVSPFFYSFICHLHIFSSDSFRTYTVFSHHPFPLLSPSFGFRHT